MRLICAYENKLFYVSRKQCPFLLKAERFSFWHSRLVLCNKLLFRKQQENPARKCDGLFAYFILNETERAVRNYADRGD